MARFWGRNITIDGRWLRESDDNYTRWMGGDADAWEMQTQEVFRRVEYSQMGKLLMREIRDVSGKRLTIIPIRAASFSQTSAKPRDWTPAMRKGSSFPCPGDEMCSGLPTTVGIAQHSQLMQGSGDGTDVRLYYHPAAWSAHGQVRAADVEAGIDTMSDNFQPDDVLFHELVHAYRSMKGIGEFVPTGDTWQATEEFIAIVLTNIYVSETRPGTSLRGDHSLRFTSLEEAGRTHADPSGVEFYLKNTLLLDQMAAEMPALCRPLKLSAAGQRIPAEWNPFLGPQHIADTRSMWIADPVNAADIIGGARNR